MLTAGAAEVLLPDPVEHLDHADGLTLLDERSGDDPARGEAGFVVDPFEKGLVFADIGDQEGFAGFGHLAGDAEVRVELLTEQLLTGIARGGHENQLPAIGVDQHHGAGFGLHHAGGGSRDGLERGLEVQSAVDRRVSLHQGGERLLGQCLVFDRHDVISLSGRSRIVTDRPVKQVLLKAKVTERAASGAL